MEPFCFKPYTKIPGFLGKALEVLLNNPLPKITEKNLFEWLEYMSNDHQSSLEELGSKIKIALQEVIPIVQGDFRRPFISLILKPI